MSSQYGEHEAILKHFEGRDPATLRFLDIGAFDGITFSNTRPLADLGWAGVCVEPSPPAFCWLMKNYEGNDRVQLMNVALMPLSSDLQALTTLHCNTSDCFSADMMSTVDEAHRAKFPAHPFRDIWVNTIGWQKLIECVGAAWVNFVNIDVEGLNGAVFEEMPLQPDMLCVEWDRNVDPHLGLLMRRKGYPHIQEIGGNLLAWK